MYPHEQSDTPYESFARSELPTSDKDIYQSKSPAHRTVQLCTDKRNKQNEHHTKYAMRVNPERLVPGWREATQKISERGTKMIVIQRLATFRRMALALGFVVVLCAACGGGVSPQVHSPHATPSSSYSTSIKTSDGMFSIAFTLTPDRLGTNTFLVDVEDARSTKPATNVTVQLSTTHLDMNMGTDIVNLQPNGNGHFSAQGELVMSGHWEIHILLRAPDHTLHEAKVRLYASA